MNRSRALTSLHTEEVDVLVIGGGITGAGAALDAATRGLKTGLIEARDWASGTSSRSSKLVHGGIRYLEQLNFSLVHEALSERGLLLQRLAPHLVTPIKLLYPLETPVIERCYVGAGMLLYDLFARASRTKAGMRFHRHFSRRQLKRVAPGLKHDAFVGGLGYWDGQVDDARLVVSVVRSAVDHGAAAASRVRAEGFVHESGRVVGVVARDLERDETFTIRAREIVIAAGVWTDDVLGLAETEIRPRVRASKGVHIVVPRDCFDSHAGLLLRTATSVLFVLPWGRHWIIGTTDTDWNLDKAHPAATEADIDYLLDQVNRVVEHPITRDDVLGVYAGLRPLLSGQDENTSTLSREHTVATVEPGLTMIAGGKLTTYRVMASDVIDHVAPHTTSVTDTVVLRGGESFAAHWNRRSIFAEQHGLTLRQSERLLRRYGSDVRAIGELLAAKPELSATLPGADDTLLAEIVYACEAEGALHLDDVLTRRTRVSIEAEDRGLAAAPVAADLMAAALDWSEQQRDTEVQRYLERVAAEIESQLQLTDEAADRVRNNRP
ncbi:glycerol-3-phosphate dehydrogenase/oxidase [Leucobacter chinensis]|uniref:glycerol-3-phosphate dehydrogenase/oxidase n=1 Tax=Leucobacter chinensis TaxID=2851010 RepID=UPI001C21AADB|nr:glycerol-3-phosphate dehydrogenase/oxidase [Leucobacter chinensis]